MNYLIYISGWYLGLAVVGKIVKGTPQNKLTIFFDVMMWTMMWVYICWRFIK